MPTSTRNKGEHDTDEFGLPIPEEPQPVSLSELDYMNHEYATAHVVPRKTTGWRFATRASDFGTAGSCWRV